MILNITKAEYISDYKLQLRFSNGEKKVVDLKETIYNDHRAIFKPLQDIVFFQKFEIELNTVAWPNGLDLAPEYLYELASASTYQNIV